MFFKKGEHKGKFKGLVELYKDLGVQLPAKIKLDEIIKILSTHRAFQNVSENHSSCFQEIRSYVVYFVI